MNPTFLRSSIALVLAATLLGGCATTDTTTAERPRLVVFLASDDAGFVTGVAVEVDGGRCV